MGKRLVLNDFFCAKVVWQKTMMLFWFDCLFQLILPGLKKNFFGPLGFTLV